MAEVGNMGLPPAVLKQGVTDMVRISDARMSGTAYGTVVLHVCPEAAVGGPLALVREGDIIELDVEARRLHLDVTDEELARRRAEWRPPAAGARQRLRADVRRATSSRPTRAPTSTSCAAAAGTGAAGVALTEQSVGCRRGPRLSGGRGSWSWTTGNGAG